MNKLNPTKYFDLNTLPLALQRGLDMLLRPADTWAQVRAETDSATMPGLLMGYALWWVLWAVLGSLVVSVLLVLGVLGLIPGAAAALGAGITDLSGGLGGGLGGMVLTLTALGWVAVTQLFSWCAVIFIMGLGLQMFAKQQDNTAQPLVVVVQLVVHALTPVWLLAPLMNVPLLGTWAVCAGVGYSLYLTYLGLAALTDRPPEQGMTDMVMLAVLALFVAMMFSLLGWLALIAGAIWLFVKGQNKLDDAVAQQQTSQDEQAEQRRAQAAAEQTMPADQANPAPGMSSYVPPAMPSFEPSVVTPSLPAVPSANIAKIAALDKKIAKATAQGDMVEVSRLLGERGLLSQTPNNNF